MEIDREAILRDALERIVQGANNDTPTCDWEDGNVAGWNQAAAIARDALLRAGKVNERKTCAFCGGEFCLTNDGYLTCQKCYKQIKREAYHHPNPTDWEGKPIKPAPQPEARS